MNKRDLKADLELCNKATPGPWGWHESDGDKNAILNKDGDEILLIAFDAEYPYIDSWCKEADLELIVQAREGWPHAIERALEAETLARELVDVLGRVTPLELDLELVHEADGLLKKAKEVLGDDKVHAGRQSMGAVEIAEQKTVGVMFKTGENKSVRRAMVVIDKLKVEGYATIKRIEMDDYHCKIVLDSGLKKLDVDIAGWPTGAITKKELGDARDAKEVLENEIQRHRD